MSSPRVPRRFALALASPNPNINSSWSECYASSLTRAATTFVFGVLLFSLLLVFLVRNFSP